MNDEAKILTNGCIEEVSNVNEVGKIDFKKVSVGLGLLVTVTGIGFIVAKNKGKIKELIGKKLLKKKTNETSEEAMDEDFDIEDFIPDESLFREESLFGDEEN